VELSDLERDAVSVWDNWHFEGFLRSRANRNKSPVASSDGSVTEANILAEVKGGYAARRG
jgi:hypothetical protein